MATSLPMSALEYLRDALRVVEGVKSCKIGLESTMTPDDYPMVRIVPGRLSKARAVTASQLVRDIDALVYFGVPIHEFEAGLEALYAEVFDLERRLIAALPTTGGYLAAYVETITDEDRIAAYKLMAMRVTVKGAG